MAEPTPKITSLSRAREAKITELSNHFANDDLTLEELERRIERVYKAASVAELEDITADLRIAMMLPADMSIAPSSSRSTSVSSNYQSIAGRVLAFMSSTRRVGRWLVPQRLDVVAIMSDTKRFIETVQRRAAELKKAGKTVDETVTTLQAELAPTFGASPRMAGPIRAAYAQAP